MTANGWDSGATAGTPEGNQSPQAGSSAPNAGGPVSAWDGYDSQAESAGQPDSAPASLPGGLTREPLLPGMTVRSPALDYMLGIQRRRLRNVATVAISILAIVVVVALVAVATHGGGKKAGSIRLTAAQIVQQATRQQKGLSSESATFTENISGQVNANISGTAELQRKPLLVSMNMNLSGTGEAMTMRAILTGNAMYLKLGSAAGVPGYLAAKWLKIPLTGLVSSLFGSLRHEIQNENPASLLAGLSAASHLHAVGTQVVSGVTTTRYNGSFAPSAAVKALPAAERSALGPYLKLIKGDVAFSVWIDSSNYVRKFQETESTGQVTISVECTYGSFNQPVNIALPPPSQVYSPPASALNA